MNAPAADVPRPAAKPGTYVYIDGFNLYYGCLRKSPYRWLDLDAFCRLLLPKNDVQNIKYFTARIIPRPNKPDSAVRQQTYLRALATLSSVEVHYGHYLSHVRRMPVAAPGGSVAMVGGRVQFADVLREEEKGSDVNLAAHLMHDAHRGEFDIGVVISNDSDLATPIQLVTQDLGLPVGVINPHAPNPHSRQSNHLRKMASFLKEVRTGALKKCQFPPMLTDSDGTAVGAACSFVTIAAGGHWTYCCAASRLARLHPDPRRAFALTQTLVATDPPTPMSSWRIRRTPRRQRHSAGFSWHSLSAWR